MKSQLIPIMLRAFLKASGLIASSWTLSWCVYRLHGIRLIGPPAEEIWYFAYGANMHDSCLSRNARHESSRVGPGPDPRYRLRFNLMAPRGGPRAVSAQAILMIRQPFRFR